MRAYPSANLEVEGREKEPGLRYGSQCKCIREKESVKVVEVIWKQSMIPTAKLYFIF